MLSGAGFGIVEAEGPVEPREHGVFGMYTDGTWYELRADDPNPMVHAAENAGNDFNAEMGSAEDDKHRSGESSQDNGESSNPANSLDCSILQSCILSPIFGIKDPRTDPRISFVGGILGTEELECKAGTARARRVRDVHRRHLVRAAGGRPQPEGLCHGECRQRFQRRDEIGRGR